MRFRRVVTRGPRGERRAAKCRARRRALRGGGEDAINVIKYHRKLAKYIARNVNPYSL